MHRTTSSNPDLHLRATWEKSISPMRIDFLFAQDIPSCRSLVLFLVKLVKTEASLILLLICRWAGSQVKCQRRALQTSVRGRIHDNSMDDLVIQSKNMRQ